MDSRIKDFGIAIIISLSVGLVILTIISKDKTPQYDEIDRRFFELVEKESEELEKLRIKCDSLKNELRKLEYNENNIIR